MTGQTSCNHSSCNVQTPPIFVTASSESIKSTHSTSKDRHMWRTATTWPHSSSFIHSKQPFTNGSDLNWYAQDMRLHTQHSEVHHSSLCCWLILTDYLYHRLARCCIRMLIMRRFDFSSSCRWLVYGLFEHDAARLNRQSVLARHTSLSWLLWINRSLSSFWTVIERVLISQHAVVHHLVLDDHVQECFGNI